MVTEDRSWELTKSKIEVSPVIWTPKPKDKKGTGFRDKTLWDYMQVFIQLLTALALPVAIFLATQWISAQQSIASGKASEQQQEEVVLQNYLDRMSGLLANYNLSFSGVAGKGNPIQEIARTQTLVVLRRLDGGRKGIVVNFLYESGLIELSQNNKPIVSLRHADLSGVDLSGSFLEHADLSFTDMSGANLSQADLSGADLSGANLKGAFGITPSQLSQVKSLRGAIMPDGTIHP